MSRRNNCCLEKEMNEREFVRRFPYASRSTVEANCGLSDAKFEPDPPSALDKMAGRKEESLSRITIRFTGYRVRPLDPDNFAGSVKDLLDGLRRVQLIPGDEWHRIRLETEQIKVSKVSEERTEIELFYP